jgi:hypothetical protein
MLCFKNGQIIVRPIARFETSAPHLDRGVAGPTQAIPFLKQGESMFYDQEGKVHIVGDWSDRKIFIDGGK